MNVPVDPEESVRLFRGNPGGSPLSTAVRRAPSAPWPPNPVPIGQLPSSIRTSPSTPTPSPRRPSLPPGSFFSSASAELATHHYSTYPTYPTETQQPSRVREGAAEQIRGDNAAMFPQPTRPPLPLGPLRPIDVYAAPVTPSRGPLPSVPAHIEPVEQGVSDVSHVDVTALASAPLPPTVVRTPSAHDSDRASVTRGEAQSLQPDPAGWYGDNGEGGGAPGPGDNGSPSGGSPGGGPPGGNPHHDSGPPGGGPPFGGPPGGGPPYGGPPGGGPPYGGPQGPPFYDDTFFQRLGQVLRPNIVVNPPPFHVSSAPTEKIGADPDPFYGSDPRKLRPFIAGCEGIFRARPRTFITSPDADLHRVNYALTLLRGSALQWFEPYLLEGTNVPPPVFMTNWDLFVSELVQHFGAANPSADARRELDNLRMKSEQRLRVYDVEFHRLGALAQYDEIALLHRYYSGLPDRIKDTLALLPPAANLAQLRTTAQNVDNRHWERQAEKKSNPGTGSGSGNTDNTTGGRNRRGNKSRQNSDKSNSDSANGGGKGDSANQSGRRGSGSGSGQRSGGGKGQDRSQRTPNKDRDNQTPRPYDKHLGPDGKLKPEERARRLKNKLCLVCGKSGHFTDGCPERNVNARGGRVKDKDKTPNSGTPSATQDAPSATTTEAPSASPTTSAKN